MRGFRSSALIVVAAFAMLLIQSSFARLLAPQPLSPYLGLPLVFAVGIAPGIPLVRGALTAFAIGYLYDVFTGNPMGIHTFACVVGFLAARLVGIVSSFRGVLFQVALTFGLTLGVGMLIEAIRAFTPGGLSWSRLALVLSILAPAVVTAALSPVLFALVRWIDPSSERSPG